MFDPSYNPTIYSASKIWNNWRAVELREKHGFNIIARWIDFECGTKENPTGAKVFTPSEKTVLWDQCGHDSTVCDMTVIYAEDGDEMRGALVEMGMTLGAGLALGIPKPIYVVGDCATFRVAQHSDVAFMHHRWVHRVNVPKNQNGSYDHLKGYHSAVAHYLLKYHTAEMVEKKRTVSYAGITGSEPRLQQKAIAA
jgi:hypothetical protein